MKINKEYAKSKPFIMGLIVLLLGFFPDIKDVVMDNFDQFNTGLGFVLGFLGVVETKKKINDGKLS